MPEVRRHALSPARQRLVALLQDVRFGQIQDLLVRRGEPVFDPTPRVLRSIRLGQAADEPTERSSGNCLLRAEVIDMLAQLSELRDGIIRRIDVKHGLPISLVFEEVAHCAAGTSSALAAIAKGKR